MSIYGVIQSPRVTEKSTTAKETAQTLCFDVATSATKTQIKQAVEKIFKVKVAEVRTMNNVGKLRRRGKFAGFRPDWKKAYVRLKADQKVPEYVEVV
jgi:large subunit ribosomal protein L23